MVNYFSVFFFTYKFVSENLFVHGVEQVIVEVICYSAYITLDGLSAKSDF